MVPNCGGADAARTAPAGIASEAPAPIMLATTARREGA
jgi:hypothetical protein